MSHWLEPMAMNESEVNAYFQVLESVVMHDNEVLAPTFVFNMKESGHLILLKGSKAVSIVTSTEKVAIINIRICYNAQGTFLPPVCIMKGRNKIGV